MIQTEKSPRVKAEEIAKDTSLEIIESEVEDWAKTCIELKTNIDKLREQLHIADSKRVLWSWAKGIKEGTLATTPNQQVKNK